VECGDSSPLFGEGFSLHNLVVGPHGTTITGRGGTRPSNSHNGGPHNWRDLLVRSFFSSVDNPFRSAGTTSVPLRPSEQPFSAGPVSEGRACHVRFPSEGPARQVRFSTLDDPPQFIGPEKRVPPTFGGTCLSRPPFDVRSSIGFPRGLKSRAENGAKAPHSMECGDSSPLFGEGFSLHNLPSVQMERR